LQSFDLQTFSAVSSSAIPMEGIVPCECVGLAREGGYGVADPEFRKPFERAAVAVKFSEGSTRSGRFPDPPFQASMLD
jgi:hypothetical protein